MVHIDIFLECVIMRNDRFHMIGVLCLFYTIIDDMDITSSDETISFPIFNCYKIYGCKYKYIIMIICRIKTRELIKILITTVSEIVN